MSKELIKWRRREGLTQAEAARMFKVSQPTVAMWEADKVSHRYVVRVHKVTKVPLHKLRPDLYPRGVNEAYGLEA